MSIWGLVAMAAAAVVIWAWQPAGALARLAARPALATVATPVGSPRWALAGGAVCLIIGWLLVPPALIWLLPIVVLPGVVAGHRLGHRVPSTAARAERRHRTADLPPALDLMATCLAAGLPLSAAAAAVRDVTTGPVRADLSRVLHRLDLGQGEQESWLALIEVPGWRSTARELARSVSSGTGLVEVLHQAADDARATYRAEQVQQARAVGVRSVWPLMVCYLPAFLLLGIVPIVGSAVVRLTGMR